MKLKLNVTKEDIRKGEPGAETACPVALCLLRTLKAINHVVSMEVGEVSIQGEKGSFDLDGVRYYYENKQIGKFVGVFDKKDENGDNIGKKKAKPFSTILVATVKDE